MSRRTPGSSHVASNASSAATCRRVSRGTPSSSVNRRCAASMKFLSYIPLSNSHSSTRTRRLSPFVRPLAHGNGAAVHCGCHRAVPVEHRHVVRGPLTGRHFAFPVNKTHRQTSCPYSEIKNKLTDQPETDSTIRPPASGAVSTRRFHTAVEETTRDSPPKVLFSMHIRPTMSALSVWNGCAAHVV